MTSEIKSFDELPVILQADDISRVLGISRALTYQLMRSKGFPTIHIGRRMIVYRDNLIAWITNQHTK